MLPIIPPIAKAAAALLAAAMLFFPPAMSQRILLLSPAVTEGVIDITIHYLVEDMVEVPELFIIVQNGEFLWSRRRIEQRIEYIADIVIDEIVPPRDRPRGYEHAKKMYIKEKVVPRVNIEALIKIVDEVHQEMVESGGGR